MKSENEIRMHLNCLTKLLQQECNCQGFAFLECLIIRQNLASDIMVLGWILDERPDIDSQAEELYDRLREMEKRHGG